MARTCVCGVGWSLLRVEHKVHRCRPPYETNIGCRFRLWARRLALSFCSLCAIAITNASTITNTELRCGGALHCQRRMLGTSLLCAESAGSHTFE